MLPPEAITEYKELFKKRYGLDISDEEASLRANKLLDFYTVTLDEVDVPGIAAKNSDSRVINPNEKLIETNL